MGSSFVAYRGRGFWSWDGYLEHVLALLADRIGGSPHEEWLAELRDHWRQQSSGIFGGWIHPQLDEFIINDRRRAQVLEMLESLTVQHGVTREADQTASLMAKLLKGELETDESSPTDYMVSGIHPYKW
jgi:hypothetical protein